MENRFITLTELGGQLSNPSRTTIVINTAHILYVIPDPQRKVTAIWVAGGRVFEVEEQFSPISDELTGA